MGNNTIGIAMDNAARLALKLRTGQPAIELLDDICGPWKNRDVNFEGDNAATSPLGILIAEAFGDGGQYGVPSPDDEFDDRWWEGPYRQFKDRYGFW